MPAMIGRFEKRIGQPSILTRLERKSMESRPDLQSLEAVLIAPALFTLSSMTS
jgi:hypothetical protein